MAKRNGNSSDVTSPLCRKSTCHLWIPLTKDWDCEALIFSLFIAWEQGVKQLVELPVIWEAMVPYYVIVIYDSRCEGVISKRKLVHDAGVSTCDRCNASNVELTLIFFCYSEKDVEQTV